MLTNWAIRRNLEEIIRSKELKKILIPIFAVILLIVGFVKINIINI